MTSDPATPQQVPSYFLQEASELLQQMDTELQTLSQDFSIQKVHTLMRIAHTLKGAAASVGLDTIKTTTHSLEDAFRALCVPDTVLTPAVEGLIFEAYACLQLLLSARFANTSLDESGVLDRMAGIVAKLQENLGDQFGKDGYLPTSTELGFDMTQSIFEVGVTQRLTDLENALKKPEPDALTSLLESQAEIFFGLAESLNLPGFGAIAQATLTALAKHPDQVVKIAQVALDDYRAGQQQVLQGDRTQGGQPSDALQKFARRSNVQQQSPPQISTIHSRSQSSSNQSWFSQLWRLFTRPIPGTPRLVQATTRQLPPATTRQSVAETATETTSATPPTMLPAEGPLDPETAIAEMSARVQSLISDTAEEPTEPGSTPSVEAAIAASPSASTLRVDVTQLEQLNYTIGELLTQQNRQVLYHEHLEQALKTLSTRCAQQQQQLHSLQQRANQDSRAALHPRQNKAFEEQFDALELDQYSDLQLLVQAPLENMIQQMESAESIELFTRQSHQALEKQQRLVDSLRNTLFDVRMQPLGNVLDRFHQLLSRLTVQHNKPVTLKIRGGDVLVDKVVADKLYDPLLHLIRNAFDHGIETPEVRQQQGKQGDGIIRLYANQSGRYLTIKVRDNGRGLDLTKIAQKAVENHLITSEEAQALTPEQITQLIFEPGFSTTSKTSDLSGRGIGLDAVRSQIQALNGSVTVNHQLGRGTYFTLQIPTNLTIGKLLLCKAANKQYAIMSDTIRQIVIPTPEQLSTRDNKKLLSWHFKDRERLIPVISLTRILNYQATLPHPSLNYQWDSVSTSLKTIGVTPLNPIILIRHDNQVIGLEVDQLQGEQELVIRPLGKLVSTPTYVYGCSTLPDGSLSLVLDGTTLVKHHLNDFSELSTEQDDLDDEFDDDFTISLLPASTQQTILIVDDSITVRNTLATTLQKAGYSVVQAKEGLEAIQRLQNIKIDAVLCDLEMPGMNGFDFLKVRQNMPELASIPTIMLTSRAGSKHQQLAKDLGAADYLTKPYLAPQLLERLTNAIANSSNTKSAFINPD